jgi:hypothetical protein
VITTWIIARWYVYVNGYESFGKRIFKKEEIGTIPEKIFLYDMMD